MEGEMRRKRRIASVGVTSLVLAGAVAGAALAGYFGTRAGDAVKPGTYTVKAALSTRQAVPRPKGTTAASGAFTGTLKVQTKYNGTLTWTVVTKRLTGPARSARVYLGAPGKVGKALVSLCAPCAASAKGRKGVSRVVTAAIVSGKTYVRVDTKKNPSGEIRGQVKATAAPAGGGTSLNPYANLVVKATPALVAQGKTLSSNLGCEGCHTLSGANSTGPTWKGLAGRNVKLTTGETVKATDGYLILAIEQPDAQIVAGYSSGIMTAAIGNVSLPQAKALVAYIKSVK
jgi:hypothetical protein